MFSLCLFVIIIWQLTARICFLVKWFSFPYALWFVYFVAIYSRVSRKAMGTGNGFLRAEISLQQFHKWKATQNKQMQWEN